MQGSYKGRKPQQITGWFSFSESQRWVLCLNYKNKDKHRFCKEFKLHIHTSYPPTPRSKSCDYTCMHLVWRGEAEDRQPKQQMMRRKGKTWLTSRCTFQLDKVQLFQYLSALAHCQNAIDLTNKNMKVHTWEQKHRGRMTTSNSGIYKALNGLMQFK